VTLSSADSPLSKYVRTDKGWRYCKAAFHPNGKIKPNVLVVGGVEEKHTEDRTIASFFQSMRAVVKNVETLCFPHCL
jgi:hypothetical protein